MMTAESKDGNGKIGGWWIGVGERRNELWKLIEVIMHGC